MPKRDAPPPPGAAAFAPERGPTETVDPIDANSTLDDLLRHALAVNPDVRGAGERWSAALERAPQAASWPDPRLGTKVFLEPIESRVGPQRVGLSLAQRFPWPGKRGLARSAAEHLAAAEGARYVARRAALVASVRETWLELALTERTREIVERNRELVASTEQIVRTRYGAGEAGWADLIRVQVELARLEDRRLGLADRRRPIGARLNALLHRAPDAELPRATLPEELVELPADDELRRRLEEGNPTLLAHRFEIEARRQGVELARTARRPDLTLGLEYIITGEARMDGVDGSGDDPIAAVLSLDLPVRRERYAAAEREARARERAARQGLASERDSLLAELEEERWAVRDAHRKLTLYRDTILPRTRQSREAVRAAFRGGTADFLDLLDTERTLLEIEIELERARAAGARAEARIDGLMGVTIDERNGEESQ